jgi:hypothetical protein
MPFLVVFFAVALSLCVLGLVVISLWWSWLFLAAIIETVRSERKLNRPEREPLGQETTDLPSPGKGHST